MAKSQKKNKVKIDPEGQAHIQASFNNIIISITNNKGQVISWSSAGKMGFKGSKKNTPYAAQVAAEDCAKAAIDLGLKRVKVYVKGPKGNVVVVRFGDPNLSIKRDDPKRRKSFRARHGCDNPGPKWKAKYWSCYQWRAGKKVDN